MEGRHSQPRRSQLLAIDDSTLIHRLLKARLRSERLDIHTTTTGRQGLDLARTLLPEVILLSIEMPGMDGFEVLTELKADPATHDIPVILISGSCETADKIRGIEMGAIDFVTKPFDVGELRARVRSALRIRLLIQMLAQRAQIDGLTGLWNRAYFDERLEKEIAFAQRHQMPLALVLCDLDRFKVINDLRGHPFGDAVLEEFAQILTQGRAGDVACRFGGEEFAVILPRSDVAEAVAAAERFRAAIAQRTWGDPDNLCVTASFGAVDLARCGSESAREMVQLADQALYAAKQNGRNRVEVATPLQRPMRQSA